MSLSRCAEIVFLLTSFQLSANTISSPFSRIRTPLAFIGLPKGFASSALPQQCAEPRNLCPDPGMCFSNQQGKDRWANDNKCTFITLAMLSAVDPQGANADHAAVLGFMNKFARQYDVNTPKRMAHFLSQVAHESGLRSATESLNYAAIRMRQTYGCNGGPKNYIAASDDCRHGRLRNKLWTNQDYYTHNSEHLGNYVYKNRLGNGNGASGDGYKYRGRGLIQLTGKRAYRKFQTSHNALNPEDIQDFESKPELVADNLQYGVESAFYFWGLNNLNGEADTGTVSDVTQIVNGGQNGYRDRKNRFNDVACLLGVDKEK